MSRLKQVGLSFRAKYKKLNGTPFYGQVLDIPDTSRVSNFLSTRRYLRTQPETNVKIADVVIIDDLKFIVAEHGTGFYKIPIYKHFKMFEVNDTATWFKKAVLEDPVTGVEKITRDNDQGLVYLSIQPKSDTEDGLKIQQPNRMAICNKPVQVDDKLNGWVVTKSDTVLGVTLLEMAKL